MAGYESVRFGPGRFDLEALGVTIRALQSLLSGQKKAWPLTIALFALLLVIEAVGDRTGLSVRLALSESVTLLAEQAAYFALQAGVATGLLGLMAPALAPSLFPRAPRARDLGLFSLAGAGLGAPLRLALIAFEAQSRQLPAASGPSLSTMLVGAVLAAAVLLLVAHATFWAIGLLRGDDGVPLVRSVQAIRGGRRAWLLAQAATVLPFAVGLWPFWASASPDVARELSRAAVLGLAGLAWLSVSLAMYQTRAPKASASQA